LFRHAESCCSSSIAAKGAKYTGPTGPVIPLAGPLLTAGCQE
jgi:hypothetical protein